VAQNDGFICGVFEESGEGLKNKALVLQGSEEVAVCFEGEVHRVVFFLNADWRGSLPTRTLPVAGASWKVSRLSIIDFRFSIFD